MGIAVVKRLRQPLSFGIVSILSLCLLWIGSLRADGPEDRACLRCHADPSLTQGLPDGRASSLYVDPDEWKLDVHYQKGLRCVDCHTDASVYAHPVGGFERADCALCHSEDCETLERTPHASVSPVGSMNVSGCDDCHTRHSVLPKEDARASIAKENVVRTCRPCHLREAASSSWINRLAFFRMSGHKKENISESYDMTQCVGCHFQDGAHGQPDVRSERCAMCHTKTKGINTVFSSSVHAATVLGGGGIVAGLKVLYGLIVVALLGGAVFFSGRRALNLYRKRKDSA